MERGQIHIRGDRRHISLRKRIVAYAFFEHSLRIGQRHVTLVFGVKQGKDLLPSKVRVILLHGRFRHHLQVEHLEILHRDSVPSSVQLSELFDQRLLVLKLVQFVGRPTVILNGLSLPHVFVDRGGMLLANL